MELPQGFKKNDTTNYLVANDKLFIMPLADNKFIKFVNEGDMQVFQVTDAGTNMDFTNSYEMQTKLGVGIVNNMQWGCWKITN